MTTEIDTVRESLRELDKVHREFSSALVVADKILNYPKNLNHPNRPRMLAVRTYLESIQTKAKSQMDVLIELRDSLERLEFAQNYQNLSESFTSLTDPDISVSQIENEIRSIRERAYTIDALAEMRFPK